MAGSACLYSTEDFPSFRYLSSAYIFEVSPFSLVLFPFSSLLETLNGASEYLVITGDFNIHVGSTEPHAIQFEELLASFGLLQLVKNPTRRARSGNWHTLDLILVRESSVLVQEVSVTSRFSDHHAVQCWLGIAPPARPMKSVTFRAWRSLDVDVFAADLLSLPLFQSPSEDLATLLQQYNHRISAVFDKHVSIRLKSFPIRSTVPWFNGLVKQLHNEARRAERTWRYRERRAAASGDWSVVNALYEWYCYCFFE